MASVARGDRRRVRPPAASVVAAAALSCPFTILSCIPPPRPARPLQPRASRADCTSRSAARPSSIGRPRSVISTFAEFFGFTICLRSFAESAPRDRSRERTNERARFSPLRARLFLLKIFFPFFYLFLFFSSFFFFLFFSFFISCLILGGFLGSAVFRDLLFTFLRSERGKIRLSRAIHGAETTLDYDHCQRLRRRRSFARDSGRFRVASHSRVHTRRSGDRRGWSDIMKKGAGKKKGKGG